MAKFAVNDNVYVPVERVSTGSNCPFPVIEAKVVAISGRKITIDCPYDIGQKTIASSAANHADLSVCIIRVGDFQTEQSLLNPLAKSVDHFVRLLLPDDRRSIHYVRTPEELYAVFDRTSPTFTHYILIGHASTSGLLFALGREVPASTLVTTLSGKTKKTHRFISLCCHSGEAHFGKAFSSASFCDNFIGAYSTLHGAAASQFVQDFLSNHLLIGSSFSVAFKAAAKSVVTQGQFRHWKKGKMKPK